MEITISEKHERPLLKRTEARVRIFYQGTTPSRATLKPVIAEKLGAKEELLIVDTIDGSFGDTVVVVDCRYYSDKHALEFLERKTLKEKNVLAKPKPQEATEEPAEEPAKTTPAEESDNESAESTATKEQSEEKQAEETN